MKIIVTAKNIIEKLKDIKLKSDKTYVVTIEDYSIRSVEMSTRFWGHLDVLWKYVNFRYDRFYSKEELKERVLLRAASYDEENLPNGAAEWPMFEAKVINRFGEKDIATIPSLSTSNKTNKQMMTAYLSLTEIAREVGCELPEHT
jgi:hypothetical protein